MTYPIYSQSFESGATLAAAAPELVDTDSAYALDTTAGNAFSGTKSCKLVTIASNHNLVGNFSDALGGDVVFSAYFKCSSPNASTNMNVRCPSLGVLGATFQRATFGVTGLTLLQDNGGTTSNLNAAISGVTVPTGVYLCHEIRCLGTTITSRVIRQDTGQFFVHSGSGSWSGTPQGVTGTATMAAAAGCLAIRAGDANAMNIDCLFLGPAVPAIDVPTFSLSVGGATQQLTAGGFSDPVFGVTWLSSNTSVATVSSAGLVTAVAAGAATITATGKRDAGQTATAAVTVSNNATTYTLTAPTPNSGYVNNPSGVFSVKPNGPYTGTITLTPSGAGLSTPVILTWSASSATQSGQFTPTAAGTVTITPTNSGSLTNPAPVTYTVNPQTLAVAPTTCIVQTITPLTLTGSGTLWTTTAPTFTPSGVAGVSISSLSVTSATAATVNLTTGTDTGTVTITDSTTGATSTVTVTPPPPPVTTWGFRSHAVGFTAGLTTMGYTVIRSADNSIYAARSTAGIVAHGLGTYSASVAIPLSGAFIIRWDDGAGNSADEVISPGGVEPASALWADGINIAQALSIILAFAAGKTSGFGAEGPSNPVFLAPDASTTRITGTVDPLGNRTSTTLTPPA